MKILKDNLWVGLFFSIMVTTILPATSAHAEHWTEFAHHHFNPTESLVRSQGLATDGRNHYWFSSQQSLIRTNSKTGIGQYASYFPIPSELVKLGDNHIGDIDFANGKLFVPIEDGSKYLHPYIAIYNPQSLKCERYVELPQTQQIDGVPWVAVDVANHRVISAEYSNTTKINLYDIDTLKPIGQIAMSSSINAIQGAKVLNGSLYMTANGLGDKGHAIYKMELATGLVSQVGVLTNDVVEVEGLAFTQTAQGPVLDVLAVIPLFDDGGLNRRTELCSFKMD